MNEVLLAVDFGTTHIKAAAFAAGDGRQIAISVEDTPMVSDSAGVACIDPEKGAASLLRALAVVAEKLPANLRPIAIGVTGMAEAFVPLDANLHPLRPVMVWTDLRIGPTAARWADEWGSREIYNRTGLVWHPKYSMGKFDWIRTNESNIYRATRHFSGLDGYVCQILTGKRLTDHSLAQRTCCYNLEAGDWDNDILDALDFDRDLFDEIQPSGSRVGGLVSSVAELTGLPKGLPVYLGGHDHLCAAHGAGVIRPGEIFSSMGTGEAAICLTDKPILDDGLFEAGVTVHPFVTGDCYCIMGSIQSSGGSFEWFARTFLAEQGSDIYINALELSKTMRAEPSGLLYLPHLKGSLTPHMDQDARACFIGIGADTGKADMLQAIYEGVSFEQLLILELIEKRLGVHFPALTVSGGATMNPFWMRVKANAMDKTLVLSRNSQTALLGAAMRAGIGAGLYRNQDEAVRLAGAETERLAPEPKLAGRYKTIYRDRYVKLYQALRSLR